jgi:hypothetical protein
MNLCYWGLSLFSTDLSDDNFTGYMLSGAIELPSGLVAIPLLQIMGRRTLSFVALIGQSITMTFIGTLHGFDDHSFIQPSTTIFRHKMARFIIFFNG